MDAIAALGAASLKGRVTDRDAHVLRFRSDPATRRRLERIVTAESECCPFLDLRLSQEGDELMLRIAAPRDGARVAEELARAFG
jgi:hypothetical protein